jgi:hypothetical protein
MGTREEQRETSVGRQKNLGSNRNTEETREVSNRDRVGHIVVEAHGVSAPDVTEDQTRRRHSQGVFEGKGESGKREVKKSGVTLGRHISSKPGGQVSSERASAVKSVRARREKENFGK